MEHDTHSFIIRIWDEPAEGEERLSESWRGSIDYVGSDKRLYFNDINSIVFFIREQIRSGGSHSINHWESLVERSRLVHRLRAFLPWLSRLWTQRKKRDDNLPNSTTENLPKGKR